MGCTHSRAERRRQAQRPRVELTHYHLGVAEVHSNRRLHECAQPVVQDMIRDVEHWAAQANERLVLLKLSGTGLKNEPFEVDIIHPTQRHLREQLCRWMDERGWHEFRHCAL